MNLDLIFKALGLKKGNQLIYKKTGQVLSETLLEKCDIDALFYVKSFESNIPVIYFKEFTSYDQNLVMNLHRKIWNEGSAPFLVIVLPNEIRVYNTYVPILRSEDQFDEDALIIQLRLFQDVKHNIDLIRSKLSPFSRIELETGNFWKNSSLKLEKARRIDTYLLGNLKRLRKRLLKLELPFNTINNLVLRSIIISYMQDRGIITTDYYNRINAQNKKFTDFLSSIDDTIALFNKINNDFNGDIFDIHSSEVDNIKLEHLKLIKYFLEGSHFKDKNDDIQTTLFSYCFEIIPIETISSIYEEFLHDSTKKNLNAHFTPHHLVKICFDILLKNVDFGHQIIIDPACGSGIFLVEAFKRVVFEWRKNNQKQPNWDELTSILKKQIYGVDINRDAIMVAIFSLYLKLLDFMEPKNVLGKVKFPKLLDLNLFVADFFAEDLKINQMKFDLFIGNPPWKNVKSDTAPIYYCKKHGFPISDNQIAQCFIWKINQLATNESSACMILPSKSFLFNKSTTNLKFRREFFQKHRFNTIINLSSLRHNTFKNVIGPAIIVHYHFKGDNQNIQYICPKTSPENKKSPYIIISPADIKIINRRDIESFPNVWKIAMWGTNIDLEIINKISQTKRLKQYLPTNKYIRNEGIQFGGGDENAEPRLKGMMLSNPRDIQKFYYNIKKADRINQEIFHRPRSEYFKIFLSPHLLIRKNQLHAAYLEEDIAFTHAIYGIHSEDRDILKYLSILINSELLRYYFFLTASAWAVERNNIHSKEILNMPFNLPNQETINKIVEIHDKIQSALTNNNDIKDLEFSANELVYQIFHINEIEKKIIADTVKYDLSIFEKGSSSISFKVTDQSTILDYVSLLTKRVNEILKYKHKFLNSQVYFSNKPLIIISYDIADENVAPVVINNNHAINIMIDEIFNSLYEKYSVISLKKDLLLFSTDKIIFVKFNERRYWNFKQAIIDSNRLLTEFI